MSRRQPRDRQRGNSLLLALIVMSALATLGSLTVVSMQSSLKTSTNDRMQTIALYAAESGAAVTMNYLRRMFDASGATGGSRTSWGVDLVPNNLNVPYIPQSRLPSNQVRPGAANNLFSTDQNAWYEVQLLNNRDDPGFVAGTAEDRDGVVIIRSTGHGPQGSVAIVEWEVQRVSYWWSQAAPDSTPPFLTPFPAPPKPIPSAPTTFPWTTWYPPPPFTLVPTPNDFNLGVVLRGWHIVSL
ncbi:MAG TPA: pilus assembly PilX N-terminal domain-containing protein [Kofleriaceae bacterium]|nr:pilus assembly PilX N-terminal domain-containing protein [Kofleriaceae bacterium]HMG57903.1 pilus assembly PilX N-terminal domain-containing protein [Kofleriaceae bacterium]